MLVNQIEGFVPTTADSLIKKAMEKRISSFGFNTLKGWNPNNDSKWIVSSFGTVPVPAQKDDNGKVLREANEVAVVILHPFGATDTTNDHAVALWEFKSRPSNLTDAKGEELYSCQNTEIPGSADNADIVKVLAKQTADPATGAMTNRVLTISVISGYLVSLKGKKYPKEVLKWS